LQRLTDKEIVDYLHNEKQITIGRSTVTRTRNETEKEAGKWYTELRKSIYKYLAAYKQRLDSLLSYQKKLHEIISNTKKEEVKIRAISELHSIEMDIYNLWKQLPNLDIVDPVTEPEPQGKVEPMTFDEWANTSGNTPPRVDEDATYSDEENGRYYWDLHKRYQEYVKDWEWHMFGDTEKKSESESEAWTVDDKPKSRPKSVLEGKPIETIVSAASEITKQEEQHAHITSVNSDKMSESEHGDDDDWKVLVSYLSQVIL
jgi:hypothetical protein